MTPLLNTLATESSPMLFPALKVLGTLFLEELSDLARVIVTRKRLGCELETIFFNGFMDTGLEAALDLKVFSDLGAHLIPKDSTEAEEIRRAKLKGVEHGSEGFYVEPFGDY